LLLAGPAGGGKTHFARTLAHRLLCETAQGNQLPCGTCDACRWLAADSHPDLRWIAPGMDDAEEGGAAAATQIRIDQIRGLADFLGVGAVRGGLRVVIIAPAEAMNTATANALLKLLEEPPGRTQFILVSDAPGKLLPTVRSRTQVWSFAPPEPALAAHWLRTETGLDEPAAWLDFASGMPLAARDLASRADDLTRFTRDIESLPRADALALAAQWESWVKPKAGVAGMDLLTLTAWLQKWVFDLIATKVTGRARFFTSRGESLKQRAASLSLPALLGCYNSLLQIRRVAAHPLNARLFLDDMLLRYTRAIGG
jgi:DNA polymerase-3 subunit delta'